MRISSHVPKPARRKPQQARSERRVETILGAAAAVIAERGFDAATLTEVAERASVSIGSLYQYFPNKQAVAGALADRYGAEIADRWEVAMTTAHALSVDTLVERLFAVVSGFLTEHPAYLILSAAVPGYRHRESDRHRLRACVSEMLARRQPDWTPEEACLVAEVIVQTIKSLNLLQRTGEGERHRRATAEYHRLLAAYLRERLASR